MYHPVQTKKPLSFWERGDVFKQENFSNDFRRRRRRSRHRRHFHRD